MAASLIDKALFISFPCMQRAVAPGGCRVRYRRLDWPPDCRL